VEKKPDTQIAALIDTSDSSVFFLKVADLSPKTTFSETNKATEWYQYLDLNIGETRGPGGLDFSGQICVSGSLRCKLLAPQNSA